MANIKLIAFLIDSDSGNKIESGASISYKFSDKNGTLPIGVEVDIGDAVASTIKLSCSVTSDYSFVGSQLVVCEYDYDNSVVIDTFNGDSEDQEYTEFTRNLDVGFDIIAEVSFTISRKTKKLHYDMNGGTGGPSDTTFTANSSFKLSTTIPTKSGSTFYRWSTASGIEYSSGASVSFSSDTVLYAMWNNKDYPPKDYYNRLVYKV